MNPTYIGQDNLEVMETAIKYNRYLVQLLHAFPLQKGSTIIDFGAGIGTFAELLTHEGYKILCVEPDDSMANILRQKRLRVVQTIDNIHDNSADYIYTFNVLEHMDDDRAVLQQLYKKLRPGGNIFVYVPAFQALFSSMDKKVGHIRRYTIPALEDILVQAGFVIHTINYVDSLGFVATLLYKLLGNKKGNLNNKALIAFDTYVFPMSLILDRFFKKAFGKNLYCFATKPDRNTKYLENI